MTERLVGADVPAHVREMPVTSDPSLSVAEKEVRVRAGNRDQRCVVSTEIPTFIKWLQSVSESSFEWVRVDDGHIVGCKATIPKGIVKFQGSARKSDTNSQMVTYGDAWGGADE